jgi:hypothetical protein
MNRVGHDEGRHGKDERGHAQARGTLRRAMWKLVNRIDGSGSGAEQHRKLGQAIRASHDALAKLLGVNGYGCRIDIDRHAKQSRCSRQAMGEFGRFRFQQIRYAFCPYFASGGAMENSGACEESVYIKWRSALHYAVLLET